MSAERIPRSIFAPVLGLVLGALFSAGACAREFPSSTDVPRLPGPVVDAPSATPATENWISQLVNSARLVRHASDDAERSSSQLLEDALRQKNRAAAAVAMMNRACARMQLGGVQSGIEDFRSAFAILPDDADATMRVLFLQAACRFERFSGHKRYRSRLEFLESELKRSSGRVPRAVVVQAQYDVLAATERCREADIELIEHPLSGTAPEMNDPLAMLRVCLIREKFEHGELSTEQSLQGAFVELSHLQPWLNLNESIVEHSLISADLASELAWTDMEQAFVASAIDAAFKMKCETLLTRCQLRMDVVSKNENGNVDQSQTRKDLLTVVDQINDRDLLRSVVQVFSTSSRPDSAALANSCIQRVMDLNSFITTTADAFPAMQTSQLEGLVEKQASELSTQGAAAERESIRSLFYARAGFAVLCALAIILLRERWQLRGINKRLKAEIEQNERQRIEQERMELRLAQTERLESLGAIAGGIAHDFNNLLVGVIGNADLLKREPALSTTASIYVDGIIRSAETAAELSHKMLAYAGRQCATKRVIDLNSMIDRLLPLFRAGMGPRHSIQFVPNDGPLHTEADIAQLEQIAMNLVTNAFQALGDQQGTIQFRTGSCLLEEIPVNVMTIGNRKVGGDFVWFEVEDSGPGIPSLVQSRIFEPFYSTKRQSTGHGFGLSVVYGHVNRHNGLIQLSSIEGHGTTFRVLLPRCQSTQPQTFAEPAAGRTPRIQNYGDVLIVDDRRDVLDVLEHTLTHSGLRTHTFTSSTEALEFLLDHPNVGCLLLDVMMPEVDGITMLQEMAQKSLKVPVIVMSGFSAACPETFGEFSSVKAVVQKPFRSENILNLVLKTIEDHPIAATPSPKSAEAVSDR